MMYISPIILASASPQRLAILKGLGFTCIVKPVSIDESIYKNLSVKQQVKKLALKKLDACCNLLSPDDGQWVLASDTLISFGGKALGKPQSKSDASIMLKKLIGKKHFVYSAIAVKNMLTKKITVGVDKTAVWFSDISDTELDNYVDSSEWQGVAGAYKIQGKAAFFIKQIKGSFYTVMGLPVHTLYDVLKSSGYWNYK